MPFMASNASGHVDLAGDADPWDPIGGALLIFFLHVFFLIGSFLEVFPSCSWCEVISDDYQHWLVASGAFLIVGAWPILFIIGFPAKFLRCTLLAYALVAIAIVLAAYYLDYHFWNADRIIRVFAFAAFWAIALAASLGWVQESRDGMVLTAAVVGAFAMGALLIGGYLVWSAGHVAANAGRLADRHPYCIQVVASYRGGYRAVVSNYDLTRRRMVAIVDGIHSFHAILVVKEPDGVIRLFNWSYRRSNFDPIDAEKVRDLRIVPACEPTAYFASRLPWIPRR